jgi:hypothetical protein
VDKAEIGVALLARAKFRSEQAFNKHAYFCLRNLTQSPVPKLSSTASCLFPDKTSFPTRDFRHVTLWSTPRHRGHGGISHVTR